MMTNLTIDTTEVLPALIGAAAKLGLAALIGTVAEMVVLTLLLWIVVRIQKRDCAFWKLLVCALAFVSVSWIPWVGGVLGYVVLVVTVWKFTRADLVPDVVFTMAIVRALMFCFNLYVLGWALGDLRNVAARAPEGVRLEMAAPTAPVEPPKPDLAALLREHDVTLAGVTRTSQRQLALLRIGGSASGRTVAVGESFDAKFAGRTALLKCVEIRDDSVVVELDGLTAELFVRKPDARR